MSTTTNGQIIRQAFDNARLGPTVTRAANLITAYLIAELADSADDDTLARAMERFPAFVRHGLGELLKDIEDQMLAPAEQTEFAVVLDGLADPTKKINVIRIVREITGLGLWEAKNLVEGAPKLVKENIAWEEAEALTKRLEDGGAKVSLK
jgi:ribosomal protein L7/L12